jgi:1,2-diacylglycerol 3-alpha-glucosyltransferase
VSGPTRVFFPCTGLGRQRRGFESFTRGCAAALRGDERVDVTVFGGGGSLVAGERAVPNFPRDGAMAGMFGALMRRDPYFIEQASFFAGFLPRLATGRPDVVYFADLNLGNACWHWRKISGQRFRLLFYNGGPTTRPFTRCDLVQQVSPEHLASAIARGESADRQLLLPHGLDVAPAFVPPDAGERARLRSSLGLTPDRPLLLSVGVLNSGHKRMNYLIEEVAALGPSRPFLLMAGASSNETPAVLALARERLGDDGFAARAFPAEQMPSLYGAADAFALASLVEGFGLAIIEALAAGLPTVVHATENTEYLAGPHAFRGDLRASGAMTPLLAAALAGARDERAMLARHAWIRERFSWDVLRERYSEMLRACAAGGRPAWAERAA